MLQANNLLYIYIYNLEIYFVYTYKLNMKFKFKFFLRSLKFHQYQHEPKGFVKIYKF